MEQNLQSDPRAPQPHSAKSSCSGTLLHMAQETGAGHTKIKHVLVVLMSLSWMLGESFVPLLLSGTIRVQQLSQSGKISFRFSNEIKNLRVKPSQINFDTQKKPQSSKQQNYLHLSHSGQSCSFCQKLSEFPCLANHWTSCHRFWGLQGGRRQILNKFHKQCPTG